MLYRFYRKEDGAEGSDKTPRGSLKNITPRILGRTLVKYNAPSSMMYMYGIGQNITSFDC